MEKIKCPNCNNETYTTLDGYGRTPFHLHCDKCLINIGANSIEKCVELFKDHHNKKTYIEFYSDEIQLWYEEGQCISLGPEEMKRYRDIVAKQQFEKEYETIWHKGEDF